MLSDIGPHRCTNESMLSQREKGPRRDVTTNRNTRLSTLWLQGLRASLGSGLEQGLWERGIFKDGSALRGGSRHTTATAPFVS